MTERVTLARPYAKAAFEFALESKDIEAWSRLLWLAAQVALDERVAKLLQNPNVTHEEQFEFFNSIGGQFMNEARSNFLKLLSHNDRLTLLPEIADLFEQHRAEHEKTVEAEVLSALPLTEQQQKQIITKLTERLKRNVTLSCHIDESLLGSAIIRAGDLVFDGSVRGKLNRMREEMVG